jgi:DNA-binding CsgD family transcriptional regulator
MPVNETQTTQPLPAENDIGAAIAHRLVEPLTALLLYVHELKSLASGGADADRESAHRLTESALRETERVCAIVEQIGSAGDAPGLFDAAVATGHEAIATRSRSGDSGDAPSGAVRRIDERHLTARENEVLRLICSGATNKEGAEQLQISPRTVESHRAKIMQKFGARNAADLLRKVLLETR